MTEEEQRIAFLRGHIDIMRNADARYPGIPVQEMYIKDMQESLDGWAGALRRLQQTEDALERIAGSRTPLVQSVLYGCCDCPYEIGDLKGISVCPQCGSTEFYSLMRSGISRRIGEKSEVLDALEEEQKAIQDAEYWCKQIRRITSEDYQEPRDAYRTACSLSQQVQALQSQVETLRAALRPFAEHYNPKKGSDTSEYYGPIPYLHFKQAVAALQATSGEESK